MGFCERELVSYCCKHISFQIYSKNPVDLEKPPLRWQQCGFPSHGGLESPQEELVGGKGNTS